MSKKNPEQAAEAKEKGQAKAAAEKAQKAAAAEKSSGKQMKPSVIRLRDKYRADVIPALTKEFGYSNVMAVPKNTNPWRLTM